MTLGMAKYFGLFASEAAEHLAAMASGLVRLDDAARGREATTSGVDELFRHVHSLKGMAASLELDGIAAVAHRAEDLVGAFRGQRAPDPASVDVLLATVDAVTAMLDDVRAGRSPEADPVLLDRLAAALAAPEPTPAMRGVVVNVRIGDSCRVGAARGFLVLKRLERLGAIVGGKPSEADIRAGRMSGTALELILATTSPLSEIEATLGQISDLAEVAVRDADPGSVPAEVLAAAAERQDPARGDPVRLVDSGPPDLRAGRTIEARSLQPGDKPVRPEPGEAKSKDESRLQEQSKDPGRVVRVRAELLDTILDSVGELIVATARLREIARGIPETHRPVLDEGVDRLDATVKDLHEQVMGVRMTPLASVTGRLPRAARDVARRTGKRVEVVIDGAGIEIDRAILDDLGDPLLHVIRNAVGHGIESPEQRRAAGKPETGSILVMARRDRDRVVIDISDDGRGMDPARLRDAAVANGALTGAAADALDDRSALMLACLPGVSTADALSDISGRGVGMDAVKRAVDSMGGTLEVASTRGQGTTWTFRLPLTLAVQPVLLLGVRGEVLGVPISRVQGAVQVGLGAMGLEGPDPERRIAPAEITVGGSPVPLRDLGELLGFGRARPTALSSIVVAEESGTRVGFVVDALLGQQDVVLKPLLRPFDEVPGLSAVTVLANGRPLFVLDLLRVGA